MCIRDSLRPAEEPFTNDRQKDAERDRGDSDQGDLQKIVALSLKSLETFGSPPRNEKQPADDDQRRRQWYLRQANAEQEPREDADRGGRESAERGCGQKGACEDAPE